MSDRAFELRYQTDARVLVGDAALVPADGGTPPGFIADTDLFSDTRRPVAVAVRAMNHGETVADIVGDSLAVGVPLYDGRRASAGVVIAERRLTEVTTLVGQVRNAFLAAAGVGLLVAVLLATGLSSTLLRRLGAPAQPPPCGSRRPGPTRRPCRTTTAATRSATSPARSPACRRSCAGRRPRGARSCPPPRTSCARR